MSPEKLHSLELNQEHLRAFTDTFISRYDCFPKQLEDGSYISVKKTVSPNLVAAHIKGYITIGAYALDKSGWAKWLCFDADEDELWRGLWGLAQKLEGQGAVPYLEPSRRGGHLWLFTPTIPGFQVRRFGKQLLAEEGLPERAGEQVGIELYPAQDYPKGGPGSLVRLPLGVHRRDGHRYHFVKTTGEPLADSIRGQMALLAQPERLPLDFIDSIVARAPAMQEAVPVSPRRKNPEVANLSERIKAATTVYEFVGRYVELDNQGKGHCPFHDDQKKSFQVDIEDDYWHCYAGCLTPEGNKGGSVIDFWMKWREAHGQDGSFKATIKELAKMLL